MWKDRLHNPPGWLSSAAEIPVNAGYANMNNYIDKYGVDLTTLHGHVFYRYPCPPAPAAAPDDDAIEA